MPYRLAIAQEIKKGWVQGFEPWTFRATIWRADQLCYTHHNAKVISYWPWLIKKSVPGGIRTLDPRLRRPLLYPAELRTHLSHLHYNRLHIFIKNLLYIMLSIIICKWKAGDGNRTHVSSLEGWCSTIELHPHKSGWQDSNLRPPGPKPGALAKLSHTPKDNFQCLSHLKKLCFCLSFRDARVII